MIEAAELDSHELRPVNYPSCFHLSSELPIGSVGRTTLRPLDSLTFLQHNHSMPSFAAYLEVTFLREHQRGNLFLEFPLKL